MIQRIQSVYLFVCVVLATVFTFINEHTVLLLNSVGLEQVSPSIVTLVFSLICLGIIFLYKNRGLQIKLIWLLSFLLVGAMALYAFVDGFNNFFLDWEFYLMPVSLVLLFLAKSGVSSDEKLIRSSDRLR